MSYIVFDDELQINGTHAARHQKMTKIEVLFVDAKCIKEWVGKSVGYQMKVT